MKIFIYFFSRSNDIVNTSSGILKKNFFIHVLIDINSEHVSIMNKEISLICSNCKEVIRISFLIENWEHNEYENILYSNIFYSLRTCRKKETSSINRISIYYNLYMNMTFYMTSDCKYIFLVITFNLKRTFYMKKRKRI